MKGIIDRLFVVAGALLFSQFPLFMQEYAMRLSGHVDELRYQFDAIKKIAILSGKTLEQYIEKFSSHSDLDFARQGALIEAMQARFVRLSESLSLLQEASPFTKPFLFITRVDWTIGKASLEGFKPGILFTLEGAFYVAAGMAAGYGLFKLLLVSFRVVRHSD